MKCLVLAAGYATRLYPLTENFPKPLLEVRGKTILDWLADDLHTVGLIEEYIVISNHRYAEHFTEWAKAKPYPVTVVDDGSISNETRLGAVRDIQFAVEQRDIHGDLLIICGDNLVDFSLSEFIRYAQAKKASCVMRYCEHDDERLQKCGVAQIDGDDRIINMMEKPRRPASHWAVPPFYFYVDADARRVGEAIADGCGVDAPGSFAAWLCKKTSVYAMEMPGRRYDIGNLESYKKVQNEYRGYGKNDI